MSDYRIVCSDELYHYGVPGMRWGHRKSVYDINANYYNRRADKLTKKANVSRTMASMNKHAASQGKGLISKANSINANYYNKKANKLETRANKNRTMASMNEAASKQRKAAKLEKGRVKAQKLESSMSKKKVSELNAKNKKRGEDYVKKQSIIGSAVKGYRGTKDVYASFNQNPTRYQKTMRKLGGSNFARKAALNNNNLTTSQKTRMLAENQILRGERKINRARKVVGAAKAVSRR